MTTVRPEIKYDLNHDVDTAQAMASRLVPFVYENETFGYMPDNLPNLTIGGLLMRLHRLMLPGNLLSDQQRTRLTTAKQQVDRVKQEWLVAYTNKTTDELVVRINQWKQFVSECQQNQNECREMYPSLVEKRVMAQALVNEARELNALNPDIEKQLNAIDSQFQSYVDPGSFVWDQRLQPSYPQDQYGFLYMTISSV